MRNDKDPVADDEFPGVVAFDPSRDEPDHFPPSWSTEPTERDWAVIDAKGA